MSSKLRWPGCVALALVCSTGSARAGIDWPALSILWSVNDGNVNLVLPVGVFQGGGTYVYEGVSTDPQTGLELSYDLIGNPLSAITGNVQIINELSSNITVNVEIKLPFIPDLPTGTLLSGLVVVGLTTGPGGGQLSSLPPALFHTLIDGANVGFGTTLFWDPFFIASSGQGNLATEDDYGLVTPVPGPPLLSSLGYSLDFQLTPGDKGSINTQVDALGEPRYCVEDLDGDGMVGISDLSALAFAWGPCANPKNCPADFDGDGLVGVSDLLMLLAAWGPCAG